MPKKPTGFRYPTLSAATLIALVAAASPATAQQSDADWLESCRRDRGDRSAWCDVRVERIDARSTLRVDAGPNGGIEVVAQERNDIEVHARIRARARSQSDAEDLGRSIRLDMGSTVQSDGPSSDEDESWHVNFVIYAPARTSLNLETRNGPVSITGMQGEIEATTRNGPLSLRDLAGDVHARTQNGPLNVWLSGSRWDGEGLDAETHNGPVTLRIPDGYSAELETGTRMGPFESDVPLTVTRLGRMDRRIETTLGSGGPSIRAVTTNGPVTIRKR